LILKKIWKIGATRCQILRLKCTKIDFGWGSAQDPLRELTALSQAPYLYLRGLLRLLLRGRRGTGREEGKGKQGKGGGRTTLHIPCRKFLATPLPQGIDRP